MKLDHKNKLIIQDYINSNNIEFVSTPNSAFEIYKNLQYGGTQICNSLSVGDKYFCCSSTKPKADVGEWVLFHDQFWAKLNSTKL